MVRKIKVTQFALGEEPTADRVHYSCPFNPRGDGCQMTEGSMSIYVPSLEVSLASGH